MERLKKIIDWLDVTRLKDYLPYILLIPTIVGGVWQVIELGMLSPSYIRFFSVTQLLSDGILFLLISVTILLSFRLGWSIGKSSVRHKTEKITDYRKRETRKYIVIFSFIIFSLLVGWLSSESPGYSMTDFIGFLFLGSMFASSVKSVFQSTRLKLVIGKKLKHKISKHSITETVLPIVVSVSLVAIIAQVEKLAVYFHSNFSSPTTMVNKDAVLEYVSHKKELPVKNLEVKYFNDKYIFIEIKGDSRRMLVLESSFLYNDDVLFDKE